MPQQTDEARLRPAPLVPALVALLLLAATVANVVHSLRHDDGGLRHPVELREHEDLPTLIELSGQTVHRYYAAYMDLLEVAAGSTLVAHPEAPLAPAEARGLAKVRMIEREDHDDDLTEEELTRLLERPHRDGLLWRRSERDDIAYVIVEPARTPTRLVALRADDTLVIVDAATLASIRADGGG